MSRRGPKGPRPGAPKFLEPGSTNVGFEMTNIDRKSSDKVFVKNIDHCLTAGGNSFIFTLKDDPTKVLRLGSMGVSKNEKLYINSTQLPQYIYDYILSKQISLGYIFLYAYASSKEIYKEIIDILKKGNLNENCQRLWNVYNSERERSQFISLPDNYYIYQLLEFANLNLWGGYNQFEKSEKVVNSIVFQLIHSLAVFTMSGFVNSDIKGNNIVLILPSERKDSRKKISYIVGSKVFRNVIDEDTPIVKFIDYSDYLSFINERDMRSIQVPKTTVANDNTSRTSFGYIYSEDLSQEEIESRIRANNYDISYDIAQSMASDNDFQRLNVPGMKGDILFSAPEQHLTVHSQSAASDLFMLALTLLPIVDLKREIWDQGNLHVPVQLTDPNSSIRKRYALDTNDDITSHNLFFPEGKEKLHWFFQDHIQEKVQEENEFINDFYQLEDSTGMNQGGLDAYMNQFLRSPDVQKNLFAMMILIGPPSDEDLEEQLNNKRNGGQWFWSIYQNYWMDKSRHILERIGQIHNSLWREIELSNFYDAYFDMFKGIFKWNPMDRIGIIDIFKDKKFISLFTLNEIEGIESTIEDRSVTFKREKPEEEFTMTSTNTEIQRRNHRVPLLNDRSRDLTCYISPSNHDGYKFEVIERQNMNPTKCEILRYDESTGQACIFNIQDDKPTCDHIADVEEFREWIRTAKSNFACPYCH
jgi:serine/threonine protein kinase